MNHSMGHADRRTHVKIVAIGLLCATVVAVVGTLAHVGEIDPSIAPLIKAGESTTLSGQLPPIQ